MGDYAFYGCDSVETLTFAEDSSVTTIGDYAFSGLAIGEVTIPARVTSIGDYAFEDCMGGYYGDEFEVTFAMEGACNFGDGVFSGSGLSSLTIPKNAVVSSGFLLGLDKYIDITVEEGNATLTSDGEAIYLKSADDQNAYETLFIYQGEATNIRCATALKSSRTTYSTAITILKRSPSPARSRRSEAMRLPKDISPNFTLKPAGQRL